MDSRIRYRRQMVRCRSCKKVTSNPQAVNWLKWQLCYKCARLLHPEKYENMPDHGTGGSKMQARPVVNSLIA